MKLQGEGSIQQVDKNKPRNKCRKWRVFQRADGKQHSRTIEGSYTEAKNALRSLRDELSSKVSYSEGFGSYARKWASWRAKSGQYSANTVHKDNTHIRLLCKYFDCDMDDITPEMIKDFLSDLDCSGTYKNDVFMTLKMIIRDAVRDGRMSENPCDKVDTPKIDTKEKKAMSPEQVNEVLDNLDKMDIDGRVVAVYLMLALGLRRAECCALRWSDIDNGRITIRHAVKERDGSIGPTKNGMIRELPIPGRLMPRLAEWHLKAKVVGDDDFVCPSTDGTMLRPQCLYKWWRAKRSLIDAEGYGLHELRHTNLTIMARNMSVFGLMRWAGWRDLKVAQRYVHDDFSELEKAAAGFSEDFGIKSRITKSESGLT